MLCQVVLLPFIEDHDKAMDVWEEDESKFWGLLFSEDEYFKTIPLLVIDGAHRLHVCVDKDISLMRACFLRPTISIAQQTCLSHDQNRITTDGHVKQTDADNMYSFIQLRKRNKFTQVRVLALSFLSCCCVVINVVFFQRDDSIYIYFCIPAGQSAGGARRQSVCFHGLHVVPGLGCRQCRFLCLPEGPIA